MGLCGCGLSLPCFVGSLLCDPFQRLVSPECVVTMTPSAADKNLCQMFSAAQSLRGIGHERLAFLLGNIGGNNLASSLVGVSIPFLCSKHRLTIMHCSGSDCARQRST